MGNDVPNTVYVESTQEQGYIVWALSTMSNVDESLVGIAL
jgi:hypothetical protein